ncbi:MAG: Na+/H+ antiporter subunit G [Burkholderiaceae bacterium]|jgi:multicomponent K+:H+ antiporter subunit G|nr:Na+/H+ antiporter subunit G [Burkholderiaceae bacterium]
MNPHLAQVPLWLDLLLSALLVIGAAFTLIGSWGLVKLSDFLKRLHGPTKATTLGVGCVLIASSLYFSLRDGAPSLHELLITLFLFMTAPVSAHLLVKALLKTNPGLPPPLPPAIGDDRNHGAG